MTAALTDATRRWGVSLDGPPRGTPTSWVAFGRRGSTAVVVKAVAPGSEEALAGEALRHFRGRGSVRLLAQEGALLLMERASPGRPLSELVLAGRDDEATGALCDVAAALHRCDPPDATFPTVERWGEGFDRYRHAQDGVVPPALADRAAAMFAELASSQDAPRLLHGDLHHDNVVRDGARGWLAIDPKGVIGEPAYELGAMLRNPASAPSLVGSAAAAERRARIIAERLGLDRRRLLGWAFAQAVLSAIWCREDGTRPDWALAAAAALETP